MPQDTAGTQVRPASAPMWEYIVDGGQYGPVSRATH